MPRDYPPEELPPHDQLADEDDELGWDVTQHGRMRDYASRVEDERETLPYESDEDD